MSSAGTPYAPMERYYHTLKAELIYQNNFRTDKDLDYAVNQFAYSWYDQICPHSYNEYLTPYEKKYDTWVI
nr:hypothetical protein [uncultured Clostridium sp.]